MAAKSNASNGDHDKGILDGYIEDVCVCVFCCCTESIELVHPKCVSVFQGPELLKIQLQNAQTTMAISRLKLSQYLAVLKKHIPHNSVDDEVHQALDGMEEVSGAHPSLSAIFLNSKDF